MGELADVWMAQGTFAPFAGRRNCSVCVLNQHMPLVTDTGITDKIGNLLKTGLVRWGVPLIEAVT